MFGVTDYTASKAFFLKALEPLGVAVASEGDTRRMALRLTPKASLPCVCFRPTKSRRICTSRSKPKHASK